MFKITVRMLPLFLLSSMQLSFLGNSCASESSSLPQHNTTRFSCNESESTTWFNDDRVQAASDIGNIGSIKLPSCINVTISLNFVNYLNNGGKRFPIGYNREEITPDYLQLWSDNHTLDFCYPLSPQIRHCRLMRLGPQCYKINNTDNVLRVRDSKTVSNLGDYYIDPRGHAFLCSVAMNPGVNVPRCNKVMLQPGDYTMLPNGALHMNATKMLLHTSEYTMESKGVVNACYPLSLDILNCPDELRYIITRAVYDMQTNYKIFFRIQGNFIEIGDYYRHKNDGEYVICLGEPIRNIIQYLLTIFTAFQCMSVICLFLTVTYQLLEPKMNTYLKCLLAHNTCMIIHFTGGIIKELTNNHVGNPAICYGSFYLRYYTRAASFTWLNTSAFNVWYYFGHPQKPKTTCKKHVFKYYSIFAMGLPVVLCITLGILQSMESTFNYVLKYPVISTSCTLHDHKIALIFHYVFVLFSSTLNAVFYALTLMAIQRKRCQAEIILKRRNKNYMLMVKLCIKLSVIMGLCWMVDGIMWNIQKFITFPYWFISYPVNALQGVYIFLVFICRRHAYQLIRTQYNYKIRIKCQKLLKAQNPINALDLYD